MNKYPEIQALQEIHQKHTTKIDVIKDDFLAKNSSYPAVEFLVNNESFHLYVDDEYKDFEIDNFILHLCLVLRELETYHEETDFTNWCKSQQLDAANSQALEYYKSLSKIYVRIEEIMGTIDSQIPDLDFQLNSGAAQELRKNNITFKS